MNPAYFSPPETGEHAPGFGKYIALIPPGDTIAFLETQLAGLMGLLRGMTDAEAMTIHGPYTWTIKQVLGHMTDCERIFGCRALRIARNDATPLPSFDENAYMQHASFNRWPIADLAAEFGLLRRSHIAMFRHFDDAAWLRRGVVSNHPMTPRAMLYAVAGHAKHHLDILHKRLGR